MLSSSHQRFELAANGTFADPRDEEDYQPLRWPPFGVSERMRHLLDGKHVFPRDGDRDRGDDVLLFASASPLLWESTTLMFPEVCPVLSDSTYRTTKT